LNIYEVYLITTKLIFEKHLKQEQLMEEIKSVKLILEQYIFLAILLALWITRLLYYRIVTRG